MASTKRAYKLQEFIAHTSNVNCLKIGRKTSRLLATGGEDHMVNLWNIGQPNAVLSLSGHTSAVETVNFDSAEVLVAAGATSGTIKLWDLEEAKIIRTLTGHRSSCTTVDFHPFGEFFASGSLDTNLKIWDIRRKGCIQTYKGHTRRVNAIRFTPDGRWVVSGGEDNTVKLWDLTAGKLLHNFKCHEGQIQCIDFHPNEFLLATGSTDRTVKFWDLESFEMIGSAGPETTGVRSMIFNPDGRTLLCGLHESLKVFSWEPIRCHDTADVGWSGLSDMNIHEGKLLGCSYNRNCVGIWVVDISWAEPYEKSNTHIEPKSNFSGNLPLQGENNISTSICRLSVSHTIDPGSDEVITSTQSLPSISQKLGVQSGQKTTTTISTALQAGPKMSMASTSVQAGLKTTLAGSATTPSLGTLKRNIPKVHLTNNNQSSKSDAIPTIVPKTGPRVEPVGSFSSANSPKKFQTMTNIQKSSKLDATSVIVPRTSSMIEPASDSRKEFVHGRMMQSSIKSKLSDFRKKMTNSNNSESESTFSTVVSKTFPPNRNSIDLQDIRNRKQAPSMHMDQPLTYQYKHCEIRVPKNYPPTEIQKEGRSDASVSDWEKREPSPSFVNSKSNYCFDNSRSAEASYSFTSSDKLGVQSDTEGPLSIVKDTLNAGNEDAIVVISKQQHEEFLISTKSRLKKLQVVDSLLQRNDIKDVLNAIETMSDHIVSADVVSVLLNRMNIITLEVCTFLLPVLSFLLEGKMDRSISISLEMLRNIVYLFGPIIRSTLSANLPIGVDLEAEKRTEWCNKCFIELEKTRTKLSSLTRRGGLVSKSAEELKHALRETF